jgi:hypothetical protein
MARQQHQRIARTQSINHIAKIYRRENPAVTQSVSHTENLQKGKSCTNSHDFFYFFLTKSRFAY